jgi:hypothetical protein
MSLAPTAPPTVHRGTEELPWVDLGDGSVMQLVRVDLDAGVWVVRTRFAPGAAVQTHKHTGHVDAFTLSGSWHYVVNTAGSYLFEPAGSVHTLVVPDTNDEVTDVWFTIYGANLNLDADGNVEMVIDAHAILDFYVALCADQHGVSEPPVIVNGR